MIKDLIKVKINNKTYLPIDDLIEDLEKHLWYEFKEIPKEDKDGYECATKDALTYLSLYKGDLK